MVGGVNSASVFGAACCYSSAFLYLLFAMHICGGDVFRFLYLIAAVMIRLGKKCLLCFRKIQ